MTFGLSIADVDILRHAKTLPDRMSPRFRNEVPPSLKDDLPSPPLEEQQDRHISTYFGIVFGVEFALIAVVAIWLSRLQAYPYIAAAFALIVGIHFFPLARLFRVPGYWITGAMLCVLAPAANAGLSLGLPLDGASPYSWSLFVGMGTTLVLWLTGGYVARTGLQKVYSIHVIRYITAPISFDRRAVKTRRVS